MGHVKVEANEEAMALREMRKDKVMRASTDTAEGPHACEICGRSGADHETPVAGKWIHKRCGMKEWEKLVRSAYRRMTRKASKRIAK